MPRSIALPVIACLVYGIWPDMQLFGCVPATVLLQSSTEVGKVHEPIHTTGEPEPDRTKRADPVESKRVRLTKIPDHATLVFHEGGFIYTMDRRGEQVTRITFEQPRHWEHVAVSHDHRYVAGNAHGQRAGVVELWVFDLQEGTEARLLPDFRMAGVGGVAWGPDGNSTSRPAKPDLRNSSFTGCAVMAAG